jgi:hypothetical protein
MSREKILQECLNTEFADAGIHPPKEIRETSRTEKSKFCRYHKSAGPDTERLCPVERCNRGFDFNRKVEQIHKGR